MILCARSASRSREQSTKHRPGSENMRKICLFYRQDCMVIKHGWHPCLRNSRSAQRFVGFLFMIVLFGRWLAGQAKLDHVGVWSASEDMYELATGVSKVLSISQIASMHEANCGLPRRTSLLMSANSFRNIWLFYHWILHPVEGKDTWVLPESLLSSCAKPFNCADFKIGDTKFKM